jgi:serine-type D-Ala-D-Ala carboxypeptidase (penicillin-binding protein 5/6)
MGQGMFGYSVPVMGSNLRHGGRRRGALAVLFCGALIASMSVAATSGSALADDVPIGGPALGQPGIVVDPLPGAPALPGITATSFVVADADTGDVLASKNAHDKLAPASTLKTLTALTVIPLLPTNLPVVAQSDAPSTDGTKAGIVAGTTYTVDNLFTAMLMMSANDAAVALADANGNLPGTLAQMNTLAAHLQADDTVALTPDGLDAKGQSSSAYDLALIFRAGLAVPQFVHYLSLKTAQFPAPKGQSFQIQTHDRLLTSYAGMVGGKNGYTVAADASYVGAATRNGHTIIVSVMRDQANFWPEVQALLNWGFAADGHVTPVGDLVAPLEPPAPVEPSPTPSVQPTVQALTVTAAPTAPAPAAKAAVKASPHATSDGVGISAVLIWSAVGVGALFFLGAAWQFSRRRHVGETDERYLDGLSRLASLDDLASR